jgi:hypothetical protein
MIILNIRAEFKRYDKKTIVDFPCNDYGIDIALQKLDETDMTNTELFCTHLGGDVLELTNQIDRFIDIDELNYLAKRLDSFDDREMNQFRAAVMATNATELKDMINLTFNLHNYTLITDFSDTAKIGRMHRLNVEGCIPLESDDGYDYRTLGESVIASDTKTVTPYGVLVENGLPIQKMYNGQTFPEYFYEDCVMWVTVGHGENEDFLYLPCTKSAIERAVHRLGTDSLDDCTLNGIDAEYPAEWLDKICPDYTAADITELNDLCSVLPELTGSMSQITDKLVAVCDFADVHDFEKAYNIADNLDAFEFAQDMHNEEDLGDYLIKASGHYAYDDALDEYYDYEALGADTVSNQGGKFTEYGYVGIRDKITLEDILGEDENEDMTMGGM